VPVVNAVAGVNVIVTVVAVDAVSGFRDTATVVIEAASTVFRGETNGDKIRPKTVIKAIAVNNLLLIFIGQVIKNKIIQCTLIIKK